MAATTLLSNLPRGAVARSAFGPTRFRVLGRTRKQAGYIRVRYLAQKVTDKKGRVWSMPSVTSILPGDTQVKVLRLHTPQE